MYKYEIMSQGFIGDSIHVQVTHWKVKMMWYVN